MTYADKAKHWMDESNMQTNTAYCIWRVIFPISSLNQFSSSLRLFCHVEFEKRPIRLSEIGGVDWMTLHMQWAVYMIASTENTSSVQI